MEFSNKRQKVDLKVVKEDTENGKKLEGAEFGIYNKNDILCIGESRQNLADETGLCLKSISRAIKKFQADQLIVKKGNQICIDRKQYERLKRTVDEKIGNV